MIDKNSLFLSAYTLLNQQEIFKFDCGKICGKACCKNIFHPHCQSGMRLLPGEKEFLGNIDGFSYVENNNGEFLICGGTCKRTLRPFACRIFPYYAHLTSNCSSRTTIRLLPDPNAKRICQVLYGNIPVRRNVYHDRAIRQAVRILCKDEQIKKELFAISDFNEEIQLLQKKLFDI